MFIVLRVAYKYGVKPIHLLLRRTTMWYKRIERSPLAKPGKAVALIEYLHGRHNYACINA